MLNSEEHQRWTYLDLVTAVQYGDETAQKALKEFLRLASGNGNVIVERHPRNGWRVRGAEPVPTAVTGAYAHADGT